MDSVEIHDVFIGQFDPADPVEVEFRDQLIEAFKYWAEQGHHPDFGRDASYRDPAGSVVPKVGLRHVHLRPEGDIPPRERRLWTDPHVDPYRKTSDRHLVYAMSDENDRLMLYYFQDDAHQAARRDQHRFLKALARAAEEWFEGTGLFPRVDG
ncbi:type II toxin-antitoxin system YafO family toxin [Pseudomonas sp. zfem002]|uniref:type II toxin-antitoxin system YafO family toxin n=1 Tax=Pseudomonas sp. zfem002 TaxID=3078197 RepID=UPI0029288DAE|nr:type II toxin-antitoxin system YafO family toxin [Pseudomonas sp. zfem002]MDU9389011.1 type II toxin-antitoxin system YafO family toxin [Pseudomonas sp. zfem002]